MESTVEELDISWARGFLDEWLKDAPPAVKENLDVLTGGVSYYRDKFLAIQEDHAKLQESYNQLTALSASYLGLLNQQKEQIDGLLADSQREFHKTGNGE